MELNTALFQTVIDDLEVHGADTEVRRLVCPWDYSRGDNYKIFAQWPSGKAWEIVRIDKER